jgi:hypothetical protein
VADAVRRLSYAVHCLRAVRLTSQDYVHRIGRTGRGGKTGLSHTLFTIADKTLAGPLSDVLKGMCVCVCSVICTHPCAFHMRWRARDHVGARWPGIDGLLPAFEQRLGRRCLTR